MGLALLLTGCASEIIDKERDISLIPACRAQAAYPRIKNHGDSLYGGKGDVSLATLTGRNVSSHYLIPATPPPLYGGKPRIWQLVPEQDQAARASVSGEGATRLNIVRLLALSWKIAAGECPAG